MKTKQIFIIIVVIVALGGSAFFLYMAFFPKKPSNIPTNAAGSGSTPVAASMPSKSEANTSSNGSSSTPKTAKAPAGSAILPHGATLNFDTIKRFNPTGRRFSYPVVDPSEAGSSLNDIISK